MAQITLRFDANGNAIPRITRKRIDQEIIRTRMKIAADLEDCESRYPKADDKTLAIVMNE